MSALLDTARKRFKRSQNWEATARLNFDNDVKFANGDAYNMYQWPDVISNDRKASDRPCLTTNIVRQHNLFIINDAMQNKPGIKFRAVGNGATKDAADIWDGLARQIEYTSNFPAVLDVATKWQVEGGVGYWRLTTEYESEESFDQVIKIVPIPDPRAVFLDPDCVNADKSDAKFGFVFNDMLKSDFKQKYPRYANVAVGDQTTLGESFGWVQKDHIRVAEYFYVEEKEDQLLLIEDEESGETVTVRRSWLTRDAFRMLKADAATKVRPVTTREVKWALIAGDSVVEEGEWAGSYIPIIQVTGEEVVLDGVMDRRGHTRAMLDAQRMYNYWNSAAVEFCALQTKTPWVAAKEALDGYEDEWAQANTENLAYLLYNSKAEDGTDIPPPRRTEPPVQAMGYIQGAQQARQEMMMASGQYENQMGQPGNERTGRAISERQRQGDRATFHFVNNLGVAIRFTGIQLYDLVPKIYDTKRVMQLLGEDGVESKILLDPSAKQAWEKKRLLMEGNVEQIFNPNIGKYAVIADMGPGYATRREEAWNAFNNILTQSPQLVTLIGDLLLAAGDFPLAQEAAERLRRMVPPAALGEGPTPQEQQMQQQLEQVKGVVGQLTEENATLRIAQKSKEEANLVAGYKGETERLKTLGEMTMIPPQELQMLVFQLVQDALATGLSKQTVADAKQQHLPSPTTGVDSAAAAGGSLPGQMNPLMALAMKNISAPQMMGM